jgi:hypothetical protein
MPLSRRDFFRASSLAALGAFAAACSKKVVLPNKPTTLADVAKGHQQNVQMNTAGFEILSGKPDRLVFNLIDPTDGSAVTAPMVQVWIAKDQQTPATGPLTATYRDDGLPKDKGFYEIRLTIPSDGTWLAVAKAQRSGRPTPDYGAAQFQVGIQNQMPKPGQQAVSAQTPTYKVHRGVNPICTATPVCPMHSISLDAALKNGKPTVLILATPKFCQSQLCGPETDVVGAVSKEFTGRINFIHVEVYRDAKADTIQRQILSPGANAYRLDQEPVIYYIDTSGMIVNRVIGPADRSEVRDAAQTLAG